MNTSWSVYVIKSQNIWKWSFFFGGRWYHTLLLSLFYSFHTSLNRWFITGVWVTVSLLWFPGLSWIFESIFKMQSVWLRLFCFFLISNNSSLFLAFGNRSKGTNYKCYHQYSFFLILWPDLSNSRSFRFLSFLICGLLKLQVIFLTNKHYNWSSV